MTDLTKVRILFFIVIRKIKFITASGYQVAAVSDQFQAEKEYFEDLLANIIIRKTVLEASFRFSDMFDTLCAA